MIKNSSKEKLKDELTGMLISKLIQKSYDNDHNNFILTTQDEETENICYNLKGTYENPIKIKIQGNLGRWGGWKAEYIHLDVKGDVRNKFGKAMKHSRCNIEGKIESSFGVEAHHCLFTTPNKETHERMLKDIKERYWEGELCNVVEYTGE